MAAVAMKPDVEFCLESTRRATAWLLEQQAPDGKWQSIERDVVDGYYKGAWALSMMGETAAAHRLLSYVQRCFAQDGDFAPRGHPWHTGVHYLYANSYLVIGSQRLDRDQIAAPALRFMQSQQDPATGGFYAVKTAPGQTNRMDSMSTGACGLASLAAGDVAAGRRAADWLAQLVARQPSPTERFYTTTEGDGRLGADFPSDETFWRVVDTKQANQCWYAVGLPFTFLILLHQATGEQHYADLADWFFAFQSRCANPWDGGSSGKAGWGCSLLYRLTGERRYREVALHVAHNIVSYQTNWGWYMVGLGLNAQVPERRTFEAGTFDATTAEFVLWLSLITSNIQARDSM